MALFLANKDISMDHFVLLMMAPRSRQKGDAWQIEVCAEIKLFWHAKSYNVLEDTTIKCLHAYNSVIKVSA